MTTESTLTKLHEMRLNAMAEQFNEQLRNEQFNELSFEDRFGLMGSTLNGRAVKITSWIDLSRGLTSVIPMPVLKI